MQTNNQVEVSFKTTWKSSDPLPALNVDKRCWASLNMHAPLFDNEKKMCS